MAIAFGAARGTVTDNTTLITSGSIPVDSRAFMAVGWNDPTNNLNTTFTTGGLSWVTDLQYRAGYQQCCGLCSADAPAGLPTSTSLTPTFDGAVDFGPGLSAFYATGIATGTSGYVDTTAAAQDNFDEAWTTGNLVTTLADCFLVAVSQVEPSAGNTASGSTTEISDWLIEGTNRMTTGYRIVSSASTYTLTGTWAGTVSYQQNIAVAYKSGEAAPPAEAPTLMVTQAATVVR